MREQVTALMLCVQELTARPANDTHNSGMPPSSDGLWGKTKSLREPSGKQTGGQLAHCGQTLYLVAMLGDGVGHRPAVCTLPGAVAGPRAGDAARTAVGVRAPGDARELPTPSARQCGRISSSGGNSRARWITGRRRGHLPGRVTGPLGRIQQLVSAVF